MNLRSFKSLSVEFLFATLIVSSLACSRRPLDLVCTSLDAGDLVFSELRGRQSGADTWGQWIELYNPTDSIVELDGLEITIMKLDGSDEKSITVRDAMLSLEPAGYIVLGRFASGDLPDYVDYGYAADFDSDLYGSGLLTLLSCGRKEVDSLIYRDLPNLGTLSLDGAITPTSEDNDEESNWCTDDDLHSGQFGGNNEGLPGTPGLANPSCQ